MKRDVRLRALSRDHHHALVFARSIETRCRDHGPDAAFVASVRARFNAEIEPHFALEEALLDALQAEGATSLVKRTRDEHASMRQMLDDASTIDPSMLHSLAHLLKEHVRFEERELYPACEERLSAAVLERIARAHHGGY